MRNKKISKLVDPSFRLYFLVGFLFAAVTVRVSIPLAICEAAAMAFLWWYFRHTAQKRREGIRRYIDERNLDCELEVDGGVDAVTCKTCIEAGANVLVAGSAVYKAADIPAKIKELRG